MIGVYTSICAKTAHDAGRLFCLPEGRDTQIMLAHDVPLLHGHYTSGECKREIWKQRDMGAWALREAWEICHMAGREAERY